MHREYYIKKSFRNEEIIEYRNDIQKKRDE